MKNLVTQVKNDIIIKAPVDLVWHAWTISDRAAQWFAPETVIEAKKGGAYELYFIPGNKSGMNTKGCKVISIDHERELVFQWKGPDQFRSIMNSEEELTTVSVQFDKQDQETTIVTVLHDGFKTEESWTEAINWHEMAWAGVLKSLKNALETGKGDPCCQPE